MQRWGWMGELRHPYALTVNKQHVEINCSVAALTSAKNLKHISRAEPSLLNILCCVPKAFQLQHTWFERTAHLVIQVCTSLRTTHSFESGVLRHRKHPEPPGPELETPGLGPLYHNTTYDHMGAAHHKTWRALVQWKSDTTRHARPSPLINTI